MNASGSVLPRISEPKLKGCLQLIVGLEDVSWTYEIVIDGEPLRGASRCFSDGCSDLSARHSLETLNTEKLFSIISKKFSLILCSGYSLQRISFKSKRKGSFIREFLGKKK